MRISDWSSDVCSSDLIAGVVNPPEAQKYGYWTNASNPETPEAWCESAETHGGSWWAAWNEWVAEFGNGKVPARQPGDGKLKVIEDAPGSYLAVQAQVGASARRLSPPRTPRRRSGPPDCVTCRCGRRCTPTRPPPDRAQNTR